MILQSDIRPIPTTRRHREGLLLQSLGLAGLLPSGSSIGQWMEVRTYWRMVPAGSGSGPSHPVHWWI